ncbi:MAG TPA: DUF885 domain-containing protein [Stellaceae bacterium]|nr:DUF885 domain-containing protein [Stellaceae bacterium]
MTVKTAKQALDALVSETWEASVERSPYTAATSGRKVMRYPRGDLGEAQAAAATARIRRDRLDRIDLSHLGRTDRLTAAFLRHWLEMEIDEPRLWWISFGIAPYSGGALLATVPPLVFGPIDLRDAAEAERYVKLAGEFADSIEAMRERVLAQAGRGWRLPKPALATARRTIEGIAPVATAAILRAKDRQASDATRMAVEAIVAERLKPAFARLLEAIGPDYEAAAPTAAGMMHQPGGADAYRLWIRYHLGYDADPAWIHWTGLDEVGRLAAEMERVRIEHFGHNGDEASFHERLRGDPKAKAPSVEALEAIYRRHLERMAPVFGRIVSKPPRAKPTVKRLAPELEAGMTFGFYDPPKDVGGEGTYFYSGNGIPDRLQMNAAPVIFHELVPGHHVHITRQQENDALPELRRRTFQFSAFNEGWAEYSAGLAEEEGLYDDPYDYYGWLSHQRFVAQRLVVDTGLNSLGWTLERAHAYMSANTLEKPEQVTSEILRYSTDLPAQALCYRMGFLKFRELRAKARSALGPKFDLADFHEAILEQGCLPIPVLEQSLEAWADERADR